MMTDLSSKAGNTTGDARLRTANVRTAIVLASIAAVFFVGILVAKFIGDTSTGMTVLGAAVLLFLVVAIGRSIRK